MAAQEVVRNNALRRRPHINIEGYAVGNGEGEVVLVGVVRMKSECRRGAVKTMGGLLY